jgi:hypothetical protein
MERQTIARKSWVAYLLLVTARLLVTLLAAVVALMVDQTAAFVIAILGVAWTVYGVFWLRTFELFMDADGVWLFRGILPWNKGVNGIKWRDIGGCLYGTGFSSWATKSATITIEHRFTKTSSLVVTEMANAKTAVGILADALSTHRN